GRGVSQLVLLVLLRDAHAFVAFVVQPFGKGQLDFIFAVHQEYAFQLLRILAGKPSAEVVVVAMCAHAVDRADLRADTELLAEDGYPPRARLQLPAEAPWFAVAGHQVGVLL